MPEARDEAAREILNRVQAWIDEGSKERSPRHAVVLTREDKRTLTRSADPLVQRALGGTVMTPTLFGLSILVGHKTVTPKLPDEEA